MALKVLQIHVYGSLVSPIIEYGVPLDLGNTPGGGGGGTWVQFCWVCAAGLSEPLPQDSLFCGQL